MHELEAFVARNSHIVRASSIASVVADSSLRFSRVWAVR